MMNMPSGKTTALEKTLTVEFFRRVVRKSRRVKHLQEPWRGQKKREGLDKPIISDQHLGRLRYPGKRQTGKTFTFLSAVSSWIPASVCEGIVVYVLMPVIGVWVQCALVLR